MQICSDTSQEMYSMIDLKKKDYTSDDAEKIVSEIDFGKSLSSEEKQLLVDAVKKNIQAFSRHKADIGYTTLVEHEIDLINNTPIKLKPYKLSFAEQKAAAEFVQQLLKEGQVTLSKSPWSTPAFFVPKPDGSLRFVLDYRKLNKQTRSWSMPLPYMSDLQQQLGQAHYFATMDITSGFYNVPMKPEHRQYTAFSLRNLGLFEWLVMPMGLKSAPATFTRLQEIVFSPLEYGDFLKVFIDDMCVYAHSVHELAQYLDRVLSRLIWAGLKLSPEKCHLGLESIEFLGHIISHGQIKMSSKKTEAIRNLLPPINVKELQHILGLFQYYRIFIPKFAHIARPMSCLLSKSIPFEWTEKCQRAFQFLRDALCSTPVLVCYNPVLYIST
jgi:hypothetical protein